MRDSAQSAPAAVRCPDCHLVSCPDRLAWILVLGMRASLSLSVENDCDTYTTETGEPNILQIHNLVAQL